MMVNLYKRWLRTFLLLLLLAAAVKVPHSARLSRFLHLYQATQHSQEPISAWDRLMYSFVLANSGEGVL